MRIPLAFFLILFFIHKALADDFSVFEKDGRFGIKNENGEIAVPAVYEELGWTNGSQQVFEGVIGFKRNNLWGLVSIRNKILVENKFYTLDPFENKMLIASIKGRFSNHLFHGILDTSGQVIISFNYFNIDLLENQFLATEFDQYNSKVGLINKENTIVIPIKYKSIRFDRTWHVAQRFDGKQDIYKRGKLISQSLDSIRIDIGLTAFKDGLAGHLDTNGSMMFDFKHKDLINNDGVIEPIEFPFWQVYRDEEIVLEKACDSLAVDDGFWSMYLNGAKHKVFPEDEFKISTDFELQAIAEDKFIVKHIKTGKWSVIEEYGKKIIDDQDYIEVCDTYFIARDEDKWNLFNGFGTKVNRLPLASLHKGVDNFFIAKRNGYWGILDLTGKTYINFKYDSLTVAEDLYLAKFHRKWGILDKHGNWKHYPEYESFEVHENLIIGKKGKGFTYFYNDLLLYKSTFQIAAQLGNNFVVKDEENNFGLITGGGSIVHYPKFQSIKQVGDRFVLKTDQVSILADDLGMTIVERSSGYEDFDSFGEGYISAKKNGRWGFLDSQGRLRISNRYEEVKSFNEGLAPIKLRDKWGFIDKDEKLRVQPYYEEVSSFNNGLAVVKENNRFGLIDTNGREIVKVESPLIERTVTGNYLIKTEGGLVGLTNENGSYILRPNFEFIQDLPNEIIVKANGKMGVLDYEGVQKFKISYSEIRSEKEFLLLKR